MSKEIILITGVVILICCSASFYFGKLYGQKSADSGEEQLVVLNEEMIVLTESQKPLGVIPAGTKLYSVKDPFGDRTSLYKLFLKTDVNDEDPISAYSQESEHSFELEVYPLKSKQWLKETSRAESAE